jgi:hypothetical protein
MKLYELLADEDDDLIMALSLVEHPAIMAGWVYFSADGKKEEIKFATIDEDKKIIVAPVLIPDLKILRIDEQTGETYNVFLSKDTIEKLSQNYLINGFQKKATLEHDANIDGEVSVVESWISKSQTKDKSALYFNRTFPIGTWFVTFKVLSDTLWNDYIKTGKVKAVSIEGLLSHKLVKASSHIDLLKEITELSDVEADIVLSQISALFESYTDYGEGIRSNAKRGRELNEKNGNKCATQVGKVRSAQLENGEPISVETIKRMYSYLSRAETYYDESDTSACGTISFLLWGGKAGLAWSRNKLSELGLLEEAEANPSIPNSSYPGEAAGSGSGYIAPALFVEEPNLDVYGYETKYFQICPGAQKTFTNILGMTPTEETVGMVRSAAVVADTVFKIENDVLEAKKATPQQLKEAMVLVEDYKDIIHEIDEEHGVITDVSYMDGHIETIKSFLSE